jgi:coenzyme F420-0:L-glutamate ligase/coenzyme F420-1:gamma-L-glutamate ligase
MDFHSFLRTRRSIRRFSAEPIPNAVIERILTTATFAPSAHNRQPWRFAIVSTTSGKSRLADLMAAEYRRDLDAEGVAAQAVDALVEKSRSKITSAPLVVVLCMDCSDTDPHLDSRRSLAERTMALQSTANAGMTLLLAAHAEGLGGVWNCAPLYAPSAVISALGLPTTWEPQALLLLGKPAEAPEPPSRMPLSDVAIFK